MTDYFEEFVTEDNYSFYTSSSGDMQGSYSSTGIYQSDEKTAFVSKRYRENHKSEETKKQYKIPIEIYNEIFDLIKKNKLIKLVEAPKEKYMTFDELTFEYQIRIGNKNYRFSSNQKIDQKRRETIWKILDLIHLKKENEIMHSKKINLKTTRNTRELGGIVNKNGLRIKEKKLYRSDELSRLSYEDALTLYEDYDLRVIIDLRNHNEIVQRKDMVILDQKYVENTLLEEGAVGISQDEETLRKKEEYWHKVNTFPHYAKKGMEHFYRQMVDDHGSAMIGNFLKEVLNNDKATLWHCAVGKDRVGVTTAVLLKVLDVEDEIIKSDYLYSNHIYRPGYVPQDTVDDWCDLVHLDYLEVAFNEIDNRYGSFENFLINGCKFTIEQQEKLKDKYLEK